MLGFAANRSPRLPTFHGRLISSVIITAALIAWRIRRQRRRRSRAARSLWSCRSPRAAPSDVAGRILAQGPAGRAWPERRRGKSGRRRVGTVGSLRVSRRARRTARRSCSATTARTAGASRSTKTPPYERDQGLHAARPCGRVAARHHRAEGSAGQPRWPEFIALREGETRTRSSSLRRGAGSASHVSCILLNAMLGVNVTPRAPIAALGRRWTDLIAGRVQYICDSVSTSKPQIEGGQVKAIAHHRPEAFAGAADHPDREGAGSRFRRADLARPVPRQGHAGADRQAAQQRRSARRSICPRCAGASSRSARKSPPADRRNAGVFLEVRRRRDRALERPDQGQRA